MSLALYGTFESHKASNKSMKELTKLLQSELCHSNANPSTNLPKDVEKSALLLCVPKVPHSISVLKTEVFNHFKQTQGQ